jgi:hypothetical protein
VIYHFSCTSWIVSNHKIENSTNIYVHCTYCRLRSTNSCSVRLYLHLFVGGIMSYLFYLCLLAYSGVQHILCCLFCFLLCFSSSYVPYVASFYGLPIFNCPSVISNVCVSSNYENSYPWSHSMMSYSYARRVTFTKHEFSPVLMVSCTFDLSNRAPLNRLYLAMEKLGTNWNHFGIHNCPTWNKTCLNIFGTPSFVKQHTGIYLCKYI